MFEHKLVPTKDILFNSNWDEVEGIPITSEWDARQLKALAEITKAGLDGIGNKYYADRRAWEKETEGGVSMAGITGETIKLSEYLSDLISLAPLKGLTIEEIRVLAAHNLPVREVNNNQPW